LEREKSDATQLRQTATAKRQAAWAAFESALFESDG
jgi:hypothetical protein